MYAAITNWPTFAKELTLDGATEELHLPLFDWPKACPACVFGSLCIYKSATPGKVGAMVAGTQEFIVHRRGLVKQSGMAGEPIDCGI